MKNLQTTSVTVTSKISSRAFSGRKVLNILSDKTAFGKLQIISIFVKEV